MVADSHSNDILIFGACSNNETAAPDFACGGTVGVRSMSVNIHFGGKKNLELGDGVFARV